MNTDDFLCKWRELRETPSGARHAKKYQKLKNEVISNQNTWLNLIFAGCVTSDHELSAMIFFGGHSGSVGFCYNTHWHAFMARVRDRADELPLSTRHALEWLMDVHGW